MRLILIGLLIVFACNCSFGFMASNDNFQKEIRILKELDIDKTYAKIDTSSTAGYFTLKN